MRKDIKKKVIRRLKILEGQIRGLQRMVEKESYCIDILQQSSAVQSALKEADGLILNQHLHQCVSQAFKKGEKPKEKSIKELLKVYQLSKR